MTLHRDFATQLNSAANALDGNTQMLLAEIDRNRDTEDRKAVSDEALKAIEDSGVLESLRRLRRLARVYR